MTATAFLRPLLRQSFLGNNRRTTQKAFSTYSKDDVFRPTQVAKLHLEDGTTLTGKSFGAPQNVEGEVCSSIDLISCLFILKKNCTRRCRSSCQLVDEWLYSFLTTTTCRRDHSLSFPVPFILTGFDPCRVRRRRRRNCNQSFEFSSSSSSSPK